MSKKHVINVDGMQLKIREKSWLAMLAASKLGSKNVAMVLGKTIHLHGATKQEFLNNRSWVKHELCHVQQFKKYGFVGFLFRYLIESIRHGYYNNKFEVEARMSEKMID